MIADTYTTPKTLARTRSRSQLVSHVEARETSQTIREAIQATSASEFIKSYEEVSR